MEEMMEEKIKLNLYGLENTFNQMLFEWDIQYFTYPLATSYSI